jgi:RimJ/RimL family protein N-acetyltransferase
VRFPQDVPTLRDGEVTLRAHRPDDATGVLEQCLDPVSIRWTTVPLDYTRADADRFVSDAMPGGWALEQEFSFAVEAIADDGVPRYAGTISLRDEGSRRAELAYGAHPWVRGRGVMERALRLLLEWGFSERGFDTVIWWAHRGNWASRKVAWRLGFTIEGSARQWLAQRGELRDAWVGTLLSTDALEPRTPWLEAPRLVGPEVVLRPFGHDDAERVVEACLDPVTAYWLGVIPQPYTLRLAHDFVEDRMEHAASGRAMTWAMADPSSDELVGLVNLFDVVPGAQAEVGYWVHPAARGRGVGTEATRLAVRHALVPVEDGGLGLGRVRGVAAIENTASRRVLEKAGLVEQGRERRGTLLGDGSRADVVVLDVLAEELRP